MRRLLDEEAGLINSIDFISEDPVQFPRKFSSLPDIELVALLSATIAWGNRKMICRNCDRLLEMMDNEPYRYMMDQGYEDLPDEINIHRTFFGRNLKRYMRGLRRIYAAHGSLNDFCRHIGAASHEAPAWELVRGINAEIAQANAGQADSRCLPQNLDSAALKRVNMALRWLVRQDGIVDMGVWNALEPKQLFIPLDVHVGNVARELGLLTRRANDRKAVVELTERLRDFCPEDPVRYDYALFGIGVQHRLDTLK